MIREDAQIPIEPVLGGNMIRYALAGIILATGTSYFFERGAIGATIHLSLMSIGFFIWHGCQIIADAIRSTKPNP